MSRGKQIGKSDWSGSGHFDRVVEVYKARLTLFLTFTLALTTLTGYGYQTNRPFLFLLSSAIPPLALMIDLFLKREVACPFLYKALLDGMNSGDPEPIEALFLDYGSALQSRYVDVLMDTDCLKRRAMFRRCYVMRGLWVKVLLVAVACGVESALAFT